MRPDCLFCKIIAGTLPAQVVRQNDRLTAIRDLNPMAPVHMLVLPNEHLSSLAEAGAEQQDLLGDLMLAAADLAREAGLETSGYRLVVNTGPDGGQSVFHLHVHLLGGRRLAWPPG